MKSFFLKTTATLGVLTFTLTAPLSHAQDADSESDQLEQLMGEFQETFGNMLQKALEDAVKGWDDNDADMKEFEDLLGRLFHGEGGSGLTEEDVDKWLGENFMERLKKGLGDGELPRMELDFENGFEPEDMQDFARFLEGISGLRRPGDYEKEHKAILESYRPVSEKGSSSTAEILLGKKRVALATIISEDGFLLTKASELGEKDTVRCRLSGGLEIDARVVDAHAPFDLALLKVDADGLAPVKWSGNDSGLQAGSFVLAPGIAPLPLAVGVVSVLPRSLSEADQGFLGVQLMAEPDSVKIRAVVPGSPAEKAGLEAGDEITKVGDVSPGSVPAFIDEVKTRKPKDTITIRFNRNGEEKSVDVTLADRSMIDARHPEMGNPFNAMGGRLSANRGGYPMALQTDLTISPEECGGPLLDLNGKAVGINIARSGRVMSYAIPAVAIRELIGDLPGGKFAMRDLKTLGEELAAAERRLEAARTAVETAEKQLKAAKKALDEASK